MTGEPADDGDANPAEAAAVARPIPVTVIGGYLGAGKTTLVNHLLRNADGLKLAVLVNELGDLAIDADLIEASDDNLVSIAGGCVCCSYGSDLMDALMTLARLVPRPDHVLLEASGVALPGSIAASLTLLADYVRDAIVILADAETIEARARDRYLADTVVRQLADADLVLLNKADLVTPMSLAATLARLGDMAPGAAIIPTTRAGVALAVVAGAGLARAARGGPLTLSLTAHRADIYETAVVEAGAISDPAGFAQALCDRELGLLRAKGFVQDRDGTTWAIQVVGRRGEASLAPNARDVGRIVCIARKGELRNDRLSALFAAQMPPG